jgi:hypothetical protein
MGKEPQRIPHSRTTENGNGEKIVKKFKAIYQPKATIEKKHLGLKPRLHPRRPPPRRL